MRDTMERRSRQTRRLGSLTLSAALVMGLGAAVFAPPGEVLAQQAARTDAALQGDIQAQFAASAALSEQPVSIAVRGGDVTLTGTVSDEASKELAASLAARVIGVRSVTNYLAVGGAAPDQAAPGQAAPDQPAQDQTAQNQTAQDQGTAQPPQDGNAGDDPAARNEAPVAAQDQGQNPNPGQSPDQNPGQNPDQNPDQGQIQAQAPPPPGANAPSDQAGYPPPPAYPSRRPYGGQYPQYPQQPYPQQPAYGQYPQQPQRYGQQGYGRQPSGPLSVPAGTMLRVRLNQPLDSSKVQPGAGFDATAVGDVYVNGVLAVPRGALLQGVVVDAKKSGDLKGSSSMALKLTGIQLEGKSYALETEAWTANGPGKGGYTAGNIAGGASVGAVIGAIAGGGPGAAIGAAIGGVTGTAVSAGTSGPRVKLPAEAMVVFRLAQPVVVTPVSQQEAQRLAADAPPAPRLRPRPMYPPPPPPYYYPY